MTSEPEPVELLWDGEIVLAVNKPPGLSTQGPPGADSLESRLRKQLSDRTGYIALPHRLDRPVGGVILVALTKRAARLLSEQFASRKVCKEYHAVVAGKLESDQCKWEDYLVKLPDQARSAVVDQSAANAKLAQTDVHVMRYDSHADRSHVRLVPGTGRMHQLRLQSAHHGHPIIGDSIYGDSSQWTKTGGEPLRLRAHSIGFYHPRTGVWVCVTGSDWTDDSV